MIQLGYSLLSCYQLCRHSGNQGTTDRPARAHKILQKISLRTRLSKPGEALQAWRASPRVFPSARDLSSRGHQAEGPARPPASRGFLLREASSAPAEERTWALRPPQSHERTCLL